MFFPPLPSRSFLLVRSGLFFKKQPEERRVPFKSLPEGLLRRFFSCRRDFSYYYNGFFFFVFFFFRRAVFPRGLGFALNSGELVLVSPWSPPPAIRTRRPLTPSPSFDFGPLLGDFLLHWRGYVERGPRFLLSLPFAPVPFGAVETTERARSAVPLFPPDRPPPDGVLALGAGSICAWKPVPDEHPLLIIMTSTPARISPSLLPLPLSASSQDTQARTFQPPFA